MFDYQLYYLYIYKLLRISRLEFFFHVKQKIPAKLILILAQMKYLPTALY